MAQPGHFQTRIKRDQLRCSDSYKGRDDFFAFKRNERSEDSYTGLADFYFSFFKKSLKSL